MLAAYPNIQAAASVIKYEDLLLPGIYDPGIVLLLKDKVDNNDLVGWGGLVCAIFKQARIDAARGNKEATDWLKSDVARSYCILLDYEHRNILTWLNG